MRVMILVRDVRRGRHLYRFNLHRSLPSVPHLSLDLSLSLSR